MVELPFVFLSCVLNVLHYRVWDPEAVGTNYTSCSITVSNVVTELKIEWRFQASLMAGPWA